MSRTGISGVFVLVFAAVSSAFAGQAPPENFQTYYTVRETSVTEDFEAPLDALDWLETAAAGVYDLMNLEFHDRQLPPMPERYNRDRHFGKWIRTGAAGDCYDTRARVLIRDSSEPVRFASNPCYVESGRWDEKYEGKSLTSARDVQIDHVVALKNAYISGGGHWSARQRCLYANYMGNAFHLVSVDGPANMSKGDQTPATWMPRYVPHRCDYLRDWLKIKLIWGLALGAPEAQAIRSLAQRENCDPENFRWPVAELAAQRRYMQENENYCGL